MYQLVGLPTTCMYEGLSEGLYKYQCHVSVEGEAFLGYMALILGALLRSQFLGGAAS